MSTSSRAFMSEHSQLLQDKLTQATGQYSALLTSGDSVIAHFETCSLGIRAHYLSTTTLKGEQLKDTAEQFLSRILLANSTRDDILKQFSALNPDQLRKGVVLTGKNGGHALAVEQYLHEGVNMIIHYRWIPPEY